MKKTAEDFKRQAKDKNITHWNIHECSMCGYPCGFVIRGDTVNYDNGCDCFWCGERPVEWEELADHYNMQTNKEYIKEMNKFWGFK